MYHRLDAVLARHHRLLVWLFWIALAISLAVASDPHPIHVPWNPGDKLQHMMAFAALTLVGRAAYFRERWLPLLGGLAAFGALIEFVQMIPVLHRDAELLDWVADCSAMLVTATLIQIMTKRLAKD